MRSPAAAIAWEFRQRYRWGLIALAGYVFFVAAFKLVILGPETTVRLNPPDGRAAAVIVPLSAMFMYLLAVFSFGLAGDLAGRQSIYPARMFALPVSTRALAGWPMLYGTSAMATLWLGTALLARWPWGIVLPWIWPALLAAVFLAWTQALMWMPYGLSGLRVIVAVLWLVVLDAVVILALHYEAPESLMVAFLAPQLPLAYLTACVAVARARRGEVPDWRGAVARPGPIAEPVPRRRGHFSSPARAQLWFEWRGHGWSLPAWVAILLPFEFVLLFANRDTPSLVMVTVLAALVTPPFVAAFAAVAVSQSSPQSSDAYGVTAFAATRPLTSATMTAAKLKMAIWSTLMAWLLILVAVPAGLTLSDTWPVVIDRARRAAEAVGTTRAIAIALLGCAGLVASTWKQLVQGLCLGLTGRGWLVKSSVLLRLSLLVAIFPVAQWIHDNRTIGWVDDVLWILAGLVCLKIVAAGWVATRLHRSRLVRDRTLVVGALCWLALVLALHGVLVWLVATPLIPRYVPALVAILAVPLVRLSAAPLALAWNRHRGPEPPSSSIGGTLVIPVLLVLITLPAAGAALEAVTFYVTNRSNGAIVSSGESRQYLLYVPRSYDGARPVPLVISLHGAGGWPAQQKDTSQWNQVAEREGFIVVYPSGASRGGPRVWGVEGAGLERDVKFVAELIDTIKATYNIDPARVYANGLSNGGGMAFVLSCTLSDRIAAVGMVAAAHLTPWTWCTDQRAVPMIAFHGTADRITPYNGGRTWVASSAFPSIPAWTSLWARRNRCGPNPVASTVAADVTRREYTTCADAASVVLYTVRDGGHSWPGGRGLPEWLVGSTSRSIDATSQMWRFFREHRLAARAETGELRD